MIAGIPVHWSNILETIGVTEITPATMEQLLTDHLKRFTPYLTRSESIGHFKAMVKGLLSDLERKSMEPISMNFEKSGEVRNIDNFMTRSPWDDKGMLKEYQKETLEFFSDRMSMITGDGCSFPKKGKMSAGVARQYCGRLGKVDNCQNSVMIGIATPEGYGLLDFELYMPIQWFGDDYKERRKKCCVPENLEFKTENVLLSEMINKAFSSGLFQGKYVGVDAAFGSDQDFLDSLPEALIYFADIRSNAKVFVGRPEMIIPEYKGRGPKPKLLTPSFEPRSVKDIAEDNSVPWEDVILGMGSKGPIIAKDKCVKVVESRGGKPGKDVWLYIRQLADGQTKYSLCNESMDATLDAVRTPALMRWSIEQCFRECKENLGMDHYEVRTWHGWRRHILLTLIAHLFVNKLRRKFSVKLDKPAGPAPVIEAPVKLNEYVDALVSVQNKQEIINPNIHLIPQRSQCVLTIGHVMTLIRSNIVKIGKVMDIIDQSMRCSAKAFKSFSAQAVSCLIEGIG